jgi:two-component system, OmpR family, phosphate regulon response regulator PhoB
MARHADRLRMADTRILVVEDEQPIRDLIAFGLRRAGCDVALAEHSQSALASVGDRRPDLILVDWMLPDMSGLELVRQLRRDANTRDIPIVMLTARADEADKVAGLESGADDYVTKPFSARELIARIQAVLRRSAPAGNSERVEVEGLTLDQAGHRVLANGHSVSLGPTEYRLLAFLMTHPDRVYSRGQLLDRVWGGNVYVEERTVDVHIRRLRKSLEQSGFDRFVQTVRGAGYRFSAQPE